MDDNPFIVFKAALNPGIMYLHESMKYNGIKVVMYAMIEEVEDKLQNKQINRSKVSSAKTLHNHLIYFSD